MIRTSWFTLLPRGRYMRDMRDAEWLKAAGRVTVT
jgi:hypothetical protein